MNSILSINARFLTQSLTGVQRYSIEVLNALDDLLQPGQAIAYCPKGAKMQVSWKKIHLEEFGQLKGNLWEQIELLRISKGGLLFSPSNIGPYLHAKQVVTIHDANVFASPGAYSLPFRLKYQLSFKRMARIALHIFTVSEFSKSELIKFCDMAPENVEVIPLGREHFERVQPDPLALTKHNLGHKPYLLTVGSNSPHKNFRGLYEVIKTINPQDYEVVVVGGTFSKIFQQGETSNNIPTCVRRLGYVTDEELKALYQHATAFILPSKYEGFGFPVLEAMTCGCPVTCSNVASLPEVGGDAVLYFDPNIPGEMETKIRQIMSSEEMRSNLIERGKKQAMNFSWKNTALSVWKSLQTYL